MNVFLCTCSGDRREMAQRCLDRWAALGFNPVILVTPNIKSLWTRGHNVTLPAWWTKATVIVAEVNKKEFQLARRVIADHLAETDPFVLADDDCLPEYFGGGDACDIALRHGRFAILSALPRNATIHPWTPTSTIHEVYEDAEVLEHVSVGGIRVCRKGALKDWPPMDGPGYDAAQAEALRAIGRSVGYFKNLTCEHLGESSTVWP